MHLSKFARREDKSWKNCIQVLNFSSVSPEVRRSKPTTSSRFVDSHESHGFAYRRGFLQFSQRQRNLPFRCGKMLNQNA